MVILMSIILWLMRLALSIKQNQFISPLYRLKVDICDGCIWLVACHKTQKAEIPIMKLLTVIGRGHKTRMHSGVCLCIFISDRNHSKNKLSACISK